MVARRSGDTKKIEEALSQLPEVEVTTTRIPHLEGEEIFGSTKRKLDLPPSRVVIPGVRRPFGGRAGGRPYPLRLI
jgi:hypothetical protein